MQDRYLPIPHQMINTFQMQICCLNSSVFILFYFICFVIHNVKRKWKIRYSIQFLAQQKEPLNKQNSLTYLRFLEEFSGHHDHKRSILSLMNY